MTRFANEVVMLFILHFQYCTLQTIFTSYLSQKLTKYCMKLCVLQNNITKNTVKFII